MVGSGDELEEDELEALLLDEELEALVDELELVEALVVADELVVEDELEVETVVAELLEVVPAVDEDVPLVDALEETITELFAEALGVVPALEEVLPNENQSQAAKKGIREKVNNPKNFFFIKKRSPNEPLQFMILSFVDNATAQKPFIEIENGELARRDGLDWHIIMKDDLLAFKGEGALGVGLSITELDADFDRFGGFGSHPVHVRHFAIIA